MRKYRYLAVAAAGIMVLAAPAGVAFASSHSSKPVLTVTGGKAVKKGAKLSASLAKGTVVTFKIGKNEATCSKASYSAKVVANPATKGAGKGDATLTITAESLTGCKLLSAPIPGLTLASLTSLNLGTSTVSAKGAVTISQASSAKPLGFVAKIDDSGKPFLTCIFTASKVTGKASNKHNTVAFSNQKFTLNAALTGAEASTCAIAGTSSTFTATYGPVKSSGKTVLVG
jgi:hypothetical protein